MPEFEVTTRTDGWIEAECRDLGVLIAVKTFTEAQKMSADDGCARKRRSRLRIQGEARNHAGPPFPRLASRVGQKCAVNPD
jgi:hypothetical protein